MCFIPMDLSFANPTAFKANLCYSFEFTPSPKTILFAKPHYVPNSPPQGDSFNFLDFPYYLKIQGILHL